MLSLYWPGETWLHRVAVGRKFFALLVVSTVVVWVGHPIGFAALAVAALGLTLGAGVPVGVVWRQVVPILVAVAIIVAFQIVLGRASQGVVAGLRIVGIALAAIAVTVSTSTPQIVAAVEGALRRLRVSPGRTFRVGLMVGVALRSLDHLGVVAHNVLDARRARGVQRNLRAFAVPLVIAAARHAHGVGEALEARGIASGEPTSE